MFLLLLLLLSIISCIMGFLIDLGQVGHSLFYEGWNFNSGNYLFTADTKQINVSEFYCPSM